MDHEEYLKRVKSHIKTPTKDMEQQLQDFCDLCTYVAGQYDKDESFVELLKHLEDLEKGRKEANRVFYMALPPSVFTTVSQHLKKNCYPTNGIARIIVCFYALNPVDTMLSCFRRLRSHSERI
jgi:glucose-6-phosphate 1-dehydrogenase